MASTRNLYDVAVIGGGPVGSHVAFKMAGLGYRVIVLERKEKVTGPVCCTGIISRECVETFSIPDSAIYRWANGAFVYSPSSEPIHVGRGTPQVAILDRPAFNGLWAARAQSAGVEYQFASEVRGIKAGKRAVAIDTVHGEEYRTIQSRAAVLATGFGSRLLDNLGLEGAGDFVMGAQAEVDAKSVKEVEVYFGSKIAPAFFGWLVPTVPGKAVCGLLSRRHPPAYLRSLLARLKAEGKIATDNVSFTYGGVPLRPLPKTYADRLLVVGTAAGQVKPLTGGGIFFGLLCAEIAANTLHRCLTIDDLSADKLQAYQRSWRRRLGRELRTGYWARRIFEMTSDRQLDRLFELMESSGLIRQLEDAGDLSFDWHADVVTRVFNQRLFLNAVRSMKLPFRSTTRRQKVPRSDKI